LRFKNAAKTAKRSHAGARQPHQGKCDALAEQLKGKTKTEIFTAQVDADSVTRSSSSSAVQAGRGAQRRPAVSGFGHYGRVPDLRRGLYRHRQLRPEDTEDPAWPRVYDKRVEEEGFSAYFDYSGSGRIRSGSKKRVDRAARTGFDPGVTSVFVSYAKKHYFDRIDSVDILDCNGGATATRLPRTSIL
jgi:saccharopine dehydrogenase (NAD+, L-lysine-forming)